MNKKYLSLSVDQRINARQVRNALNINALFSCTMEGITRGWMRDKDFSHPVINNRLYHHIGKTHSMYPIL